MFMLSTPALTNRQRSGDGLSAVVDNRGYAPSSRTSDDKTSDCGTLHTRPSWLATNGGDSYTLQQRLALPHDDDDCLKT